MVDKNLFLYDLAIVAIFKNEARYLKEWIAYHLLAGVEHFYFYNNDSTDDYKEVLAPYVEKNLVTLIEWSGNLMQMPVLNDALKKYRFECRYMAFVDIDEFIFPRTGQSILEVIDEILSANSNAAGLAINWQMFGSNGQIKADYSRGVLERFTRRAPRHWIFKNKTDGSFGGNTSIKSIVDPRRAWRLVNPHFAIYFNPFRAVNELGKVVENYMNNPITIDKIVVNHYYVKSDEERALKTKRGSPTIGMRRSVEVFDTYNRNDEYDDDILKYRAERAKNFSFEDDQQRINRVVNSLVKTLTEYSPENAPAEFFVGKLETFLTCRAIAEKFQIKIGNYSAEELALVWICRAFNQSTSPTFAELHLFVETLPGIIVRPFSICKQILQLTLERVLPYMSEFLKVQFNIYLFLELQYIQELLRLTKL